jgi:ABC-type multidrug transport system permease subunit
MMKNKLFSWRLLGLGVVVTLVVFLAHYFSSFLEELVMEGLWFGWILLFLWYLVFLYFAIAGYVKFVKVK